MQVRWYLDRQLAEVVEESPAIAFLTIQCLNTLLVTLLLFVAGALVP
jgi:hypothetical protein